LTMAAARLGGLRAAIVLTLGMVPVEAYHAAAGAAQGPRSVIAHSGRCADAATSCARRRGHPRLAAATPADSSSSSGSRASAVQDAPVRPSFNNTWYPVAHSSQVVADQVFATRLLGEPIVVYRDENGEATCVRDVCPHRSAPLSMGEMQEGALRCFYHGWAFGTAGGCVDVPTIRMTSGSKRANFGAFSCSALAVLEHDSFVWVWRGHPLTADRQKLPPMVQSNDVEDGMLAIETTLDYGVEWSHVVATNLGAPHLHWLLAGSALNLAALGSESSRRLEPASVQSTAQFHAPSIVRHVGANGRTEQVHVVPIAPHRTRVLIRQHFKKESVLSALLQLPGALQLFTRLVRQSNYAVATREVEEGSLMDVIDVPVGAADGAAAQFWTWHARAVDAEGSPYFKRWGEGRAPSETLGRQQTDSEDSGTYGLKKSYVQDHPVPEFAPLKR